MILMQEEISDYIKDALGLFNKNSVKIMSIPHFMSLMPCHCLGHLMDNYVFITMVDERNRFIREADFSYENKMII